MRTQPTWCIPLLVLQVSSFAFAASLPPGNAVASEYTHRLFRIEDGLPQNRIRALCQTPDGYLWIGTAEGLARFDGLRFTIFDQSNAPALHDDGILTLRVGHDGALWIGTEGGGLARYMGGVFRNYGSSEGLTNGFVRAIYEDGRKTLWVGTDRGFFRGEGDRFVRLDNTPEVPLASVVGIGEDAAGKIWVATGSGLLSVAGNNLTRVHSNCPSIPVRTLHASRQSFLWAIGPSGASRMRGGCAVPDRSLPAVSMRSLIEDSGGDLWIGTMGQGLIRLRGGRAASFTTSSGLPHNTVNAVFEDRERDLWIGCEDGLVRLTPKSGTSIGRQDGLEDDDVLTVYPDAQNNLWITTLTGQVYRVSGTTAKRYRLPRPAADLQIRTVFQDHHGTFWFGTAGSGVVRQDPQSVTVYTKADGLRSNMVRQILEDKSGAIWIALDSGLSRWDGRSFKNYYLEDGLSYPSTRCMITDTRGDVLVGTDAGLNRLHNGQIVRDNEFAALAKEKIWAIYQDPGDTLWLGTRGGGLLRFRSGEVRRFTRENGLLTNTIFQILGDGGGKIWMSSSSGIISAERKELDAASKVSAQSIHVIPYGTADGMATRQMNGGTQPAGAITAAGELWFPSVKGAVRISPSGMPPRQTAPVIIERILADDQPVPLSENIIIPPGHGRLTIDFTLCDLADPQRVGFRYQLEGLDDGWMTALHGRSASYTNLPPGPYRFRVVSNVASSLNVSEAIVTFTLQPHFYQTRWFYGLLALAAGMALWCGFALYARQTRARYELLLTERARLAREMHDTVIQGCVGVSTLLDAAARFRNLDAGEAETLLDQARTQATSTLEEARQAVWDLRHPDAAESSIHLLFDLARKLGVEHGIQIDTEIVGKGAADPETDRTLLLVGREALRNAVAHSKARRVSVRIHFEPSSVCLEVSDDGSGFVAERDETGQNRHFGIVGMRERVAELGGAFSIVSGQGSGTKVVARLPLFGLGPGEPTFRQSRAGGR